MRPRYKVAVAFALCCQLVLGCDPGAEPPGFESELWPGEGRPRFEALGPELVLRSEPSMSADPRALAVSAGAEMSYDETRVRTTAAGTVTATTAGELEARSLGEIDYLSVDHYYDESADWRALPYEAGDSIEVLQERAEGGCLLRRGEQVLEAAHCAWLSGSTAGDFELTAEPTIEWWVRLIDDAGGPLGWLLIEADSVRQLPREL